MNDIGETFLLTRDTLMFLPLIIFCFLPVAQRRKHSLGKLCIRIFVAILLVEVLIFSIYFFLPYYIADLLNGIVCFSIFFWFYQREVEVEKSHLLFVFLTACLIGGFSYLVYHTVDIFFNPTGTASGALATNVFLIQVSFESLFILLIAYPTKKYLGWLVLYFHDEKSWQKVSIFPVLFTFVFYVFIPLDNSKMYIGRALNLYMIAVFVFVIITFIIYILFYQIAYNIVEKQKILERSIYLEMEAEQYRKLQEYVELTSRLRHDFRYHFTALCIMMEKKQYNEAEAYIKRYSLVNAKPVKHYCPSNAINAVLNHYANSCQEENIAVNFSVCINGHQEYLDADFCVILGNLLENALYACRNQEKEARHIELKIAQISAHLIVLSICNPYFGTVIKEGIRFISTKHTGKGQGLNSVSLIAEKYNGYMKVEYNDNQFMVKVLLNV